MNQIAGFSSMGTRRLHFRVCSSSSSAAIAIVGLRGRYNERRDFLITTTAPVDEGGSPPTTELFFPHLADSEATHKFVLCSGSAGQAQLEHYGFLAGRTAVQPFSKIAVERQTI
jgi:hypothetical protein